MKITASVDFGLIRGEADREGMFKGMHEAQKFRAMVSCTRKEATLAVS